MFVFIFLLLGGFSLYEGEKDWYAYPLIGFVILMIGFTADYFATLSTNKDIPIEYSNLYQEGEVIKGFSNNMIVKSDKMISMENNNQASAYITEKAKWVYNAKQHNSKVLNIMWRYDINPIMSYMGYGMKPFDTKEELSKYLLEIK